VKDHFVVAALVVGADRRQEKIEGAQDLVFEVVNPLLQARRTRPAKMQYEKLGVRRRRGFQNLGQLHNYGRATAVLHFELGVQLPGKDLGVKLQEWVGHEDDIL
jgi:hypothetical protein